MNLGPLGSRLWRGMLITALAWLLLVDTARADEETGGGASLGIELNKIEDTDEGCRAIVVLDNQTRHELNRFRIDLVLFDPKGVYKKQLLVDMAPLYLDKKTVASLLLDDKPCAGIGSILVNDVPWCEDGSGATIGCVRMLEVSSLAGVPLNK